MQKPSTPQGWWEQYRWSSSDMMGSSYPALHVIIFKPINNWMGSSDKCDFNLLSTSRISWARCYSNADKWCVFKSTLPYYLANPSKISIKCTGSNEILLVATLKWTFRSLSHTLLQIHHNGLGIQLKPIFFCKVHQIHQVNDSKVLHFPQSSIHKWENEF